jgi:hypothetical protein
MNLDPARIRHVIVCAAVCFAFASQSNAEPVLDASTPDAFAESGEAMIEHAKSSGIVGIQDLAKIEMAVAAALMESMSNAMDKGGLNLTPESAKDFASDTLQKYDGMNAQEFLKAFTRQANRQDGGRMDPSTANQWQSVFADFQKYSLGAELNFIDIYAAREMTGNTEQGRKQGNEIIYQRIKYNPEDISEPIDFYEVLFEYWKDGKPHDVVTAIYNLPLGQFAFSGLQKNKTNDIGPNGVLPFGASKHHLSFSDVEVYSPSADAISITIPIYMLERSVKHKEKFEEWSEIARANDVEPFRKPFPGEDDQGLHFIWDGSGGAIVSKSYMASDFEHGPWGPNEVEIRLTEKEMQFAEDLVLNFRDILKKAPLAKAKQDEVAAQSEKEAQQKIDAMFN